MHTRQYSESDDWRHICFGFSLSHILYDYCRWYEKTNKSCYYANEEWIPPLYGGISYSSDYYRFWSLILSNAREVNLTKRFRAKNFLWSAPMHAFNVLKHNITKIWDFQVIKEKSSWLRSFSIFLPKTYHIIHYLFYPELFSLVRGCGHKSLSPILLPLRNLKVQLYPMRYTVGEEDLGRAIT